MRLGSSNPTVKLLLLAAAVALSATTAAAAKTYRRGAMVTVTGSVSDPFGEGRIEGLRIDLLVSKKGGGPEGRVLYVFQHSATKTAASASIGSGIPTTTSSACTW